MIYIGTSGYSFEDWQTFYPAGLRSGARLSYYARRFPAVEVNSTYYRLPHPVVFRRMEEKTPPGFRFIVKLHQDVTHKGLAEPDHFRTFFDVISPLEEAGKFHGALAQFPWGFRRTQKGVDHLRRVCDLMQDRPLFVEFRNDSWAREETFAELRALGAGFCCVDEPRLPGLFPSIVKATTDTAYVRFHGRNAQHWWGGSDMLRYDYDYPDAELLHWVQAVRDLESSATDTYLFFNNCHAGHAAENALRMSELLAP